MNNRKQTKIDFSNRFDKYLRKAPLGIKIDFRERLTLFIQDPFHPLLNNHALAGQYRGYRSINITGDWRAIYREIDGIILFDVLGTHSQLYK